MTGCVCVCALSIVWFLMCKETNVLCAASGFGTGCEQKDLLPSIPLLIKKAHNGNYGKTARANLESDDFAAKVGVALVNESEMTRLRR